MMGFWIGLGGGIGAVARFAIGGWVTTWAAAGFPWGTLAINVLGSTLLGFLHRALPMDGVDPSRRAFLTIGLCGGFTTFSAFDFETFALLRDGRMLAAGTYSLGSVVACVAGVALGIALASRNPPSPIRSDA
jgi:fluoride exporter